MDLGIVDAQRNHIPRTPEDEVRRAQHQAIGVPIPEHSRTAPPFELIVRPIASYLTPTPCQLFPAISGSMPSILATARLAEFKCMRQSKSIAPQTKRPFQFMNFSGV